VDFAITFGIEVNVFVRGNFGVMAGRAAGKLEAEIDSTG
jgi:hypothetical protein